MSDHVPIIWVGVDRNINVLLYSLVCLDNLDHATIPLEDRCYDKVLICMLLSYVNHLENISMGHGITLQEVSHVCMPISWRP